MRRRAKVDTNHSALVEVFRAHGCLVQSLAPLGRGVPDLLVHFRGFTWLVEVKRPKGKLTSDQVTFQDRGWPVHVVKSEADVQELIHKGKVTW